jgi:hypothetical protein
VLPRKPQETSSALPQSPVRFRQVSQHGLDSLVLPADQKNAYLHRVVAAVCEAGVAVG